MEDKTIKAIPTLKQYLEDIYDYDYKALKIPIGYEMFQKIKSVSFNETDKENRFKKERWFNEYEPKIRELLEISIIQTIKIIQYYEKDRGELGELKAREMTRLKALLILTKQ